MPKLKVQIPKLCRHHKGHAFVKIEGRQIWLGMYGEPDTIEAYNRLIAGWLANGRKLPHLAAEASSDVTVSVLIRDYLQHCERIHSRANRGLLELRIADGLGLITLASRIGCDTLELRIADGLGLITLSHTRSTRYSKLRIADGLGLITLDLTEPLEGISCGLLTGWG